MNTRIIQDIPPSIQDEPGILLDIKNALRSDRPVEVTQAVGDKRYSMTIHLTRSPAGGYRLQLSGSEPASVPPETSKLKRTQDVIELLLEQAGVENPRKGNAGVLGGGSKASGLNSVTVNWHLDQEDLDCVKAAAGIPDFAAGVEASRSASHKGRGG